jgi:signal peptidase I
MSEKPPYEDQRFQTSRETRRERRRRRATKKRGGGVLEFLIILLVSFALVFGFVRPFVVEAFYIPSESMVPTLKVGDRVLVNKFIYRFTEPKRGDIVVFKSVEGGDEDLIKRVVGVPGDKISVRNGRLFVNGEPQREPYVNKKYPDRSFSAPTTVPKGHIFVMGDNRTNSQDSRVFGPVPKRNIEGEAFLRFWPPDRIGWL